MSQLERIIHIDAQIRAHAHPNAASVAAEFEISRRQAYQDHAYLRDRLKAPIAYSRSRRGWYYTDPTYLLPAITLRQGELLAFLLAHDLSHRYLGTPFEESFGSALQKIREYLPKTVTVSADALRHVVAVTGGLQTDVDPSLLFTLNRAAAERLRMRMSYYSPRSGKTLERVIDPYHLHNLRGSWYLIAYCHRRRAVLDFFLPRIREYALLEDRFQPSEGFDLERYLKRGFLAERNEVPDRVCIRFDEYQARWVRERRYHPTQTVEELTDGGVLLRMETGGLEEVARWVLGFGPHAEVLEPPELRRMVAERAKLTAEIYGDESSESIVHRKSI